jgi:hypothetical protein
MICHMLIYNRMQVIIFPSPYLQHNIGPVETEEIFRSDCPELLPLDNMCGVNAWLLCSQQSVERA